MTTSPATAALTVDQRPARHRRGPQTLRDYLTRGLGRAIYSSAVLGVIAVLVHGLTR